MKEFGITVSRADEAEKESNPIAAREILENAAQLYRGDLLPGLYDEWIEERRRLSEKHTEVLNRRFLLEQKREYLGPFNTQNACWVWTRYANELSKSHASSRAQW